MKEYVKKVIPYSYEETDAIEAWLEELAREGLVLERDGCFGLVFRRSEPTHLRYRMESIPGANLERKKRRREQLAEQGWQYVTILPGTTVYKHEDLSQSELPQQEEMTQKQKFVSGIYQVGSLVFILLAYIVLILLTFLGKSTLDLVTKDFYDFSSFFILTLLLILAAVAGRYHKHQVNKRKADDSFLKRSYHTKERARRGSRCMLALTCFTILVPIMNTVFDVSSRNQWEFIPTLQYQYVLPVPQLSELVALENETRKATGLAELTEGRSLSQDEIIENHYFLMPRQLMLYQSKGRSIYYRPFYYELRSEDLAKKVLEDLVKEYPYEALPIGQGVQAHYYHATNEENWPSQALLIGYENKIIQVSYKGELNVSHYGHLFAQYLGAD